MAAAMLSSGVSTAKAVGKATVEVDVDVSVAASRNEKRGER
jgi:hypothetical protein